MKYQVVEKFVSINGEGRRAGELAVFIRLKGCNLACSYCDTSWANQPDCACEEMTADEILSYIRSTGVRNVTLTGGEPLLRDGMEHLIKEILSDSFYRVEIETNGSVSIAPFQKMSPKPSITIDYKLPESGMEEKMQYENFRMLSAEDTVKFVVSSAADMERACEVIEECGLLRRTAIYFSPVFGRIEPVELVNFLTKKKLNDVKVQIQLHKIIWNPNQRGV